MIQEHALNQFLDYAQHGKRVAVYREIPADRLTLAGIVENLSAEMETGAILESGSLHHSGGRYSFIMFDLISQLVIEKKSTTENPLQALRESLQKFTCTGPAHILNLMNNGIGFFTYDAIRFFEAIPDRHGDSTLPEIVFNFYQTHLTFDHFQQKLYIALSIKIGEDPQKDFELAQEKIQHILTKIYKPASFQKNLESRAALTERFQPEIQVDLSDEAFMQQVLQAKQYIEAGDAFQIVLSRRFSRPFYVPAFEIYRALQRVSPAPYMFYLSYQNQIILGASPEKFISVTQDEVFINPIAGTRSRAKLTPDQIEQELLHDKKERAEHTMLVDLARNDLGSVCCANSVTVQQFLQVKHFSHVSHLTSTISGKLPQNKDALDAFTAAFPAGTLSGAPKIRAMTIIDELETSKRGIYGGAICRIDHQGNLDSCIAIRMAQLKDQTAIIRTGAGIVFDSDPFSEAQETRAKAAGVLEAIAVAEREYDHIDR